MDNYINLKPVSELLGMNFFIPSYQRGYRWQQQQINDLLDDIHSFAIKKDKLEKEFYCLQPIIVKKRNIIDSNFDEYEVIDGQQRLTTIRILFSYLINEYLNGKSLEKRYGKSLYTINFETRPGCVDFLNEINLEENSNIDYYHIAQAYIHISSWFENKVDQDEDNMFDDICDSIIRTLVYNQKNKKPEGLLQVIWYEIKDNNTNPIDTFIRINLGKISLTNAELIKALFLQERNFGDGDIAKLKQLEIAQKWDRIENKMQEENFWWFLNKGENKSSSHIEFIFDMICNIDENIDENIIGNDANRTFLYYNYRFGNSTNYDLIKKLWKEIEEKFETLQEWYLTHDWYHYIGFLIYCGRSVQEIMIWLNDESIISKGNVTTKLIGEIKKEFKSIKWEKHTKDKFPYINLPFSTKKSIDEIKKELKNIKWETPIKGNAHINLTYNTDTRLLRKFFLLFNLEYINQQSNNENLIYYFPFKSFKVGKVNQESIAWDIEHVNSATENPLEKQEDKEEWLKNVKQDIVDIPKDLNNKINSFLTDSKSGVKFESLQNDIIKLAKEHDISDELKNCIGNLTLLDAGTNRGYGNSLFSTKRRIIIEKDRNGTFIPLCTKNVFLKYFDGNVQSQWLEQDIEAYRDILEKTMEKFLPKKEVYNEI